MRCLFVLGSLLLLSVFARSLALPCETNTDRGPIIVTDEPPVIESVPDKIPAGPRTEIISNLSRNSTQVNTTSDTKAKQKVKTKERKDGSIVTIIVDKERTKNKTKALTDSFDQTNHTIVQDGVEDSSSLTKEKQQQLKQVSIAKKISKEKIITDKYGNVVSDTVKAKTLEKDRKSEKTKESESLVRTVKQLTTPPDLCVTVTVSPTTPTPIPTSPPLPPCGCRTTTEVPIPPCGCRTTTTEAPIPPCVCRRTTTTEAPTQPCGHRGD